MWRENTPTWTASLATRHVRFTFCATLFMSKVLRLTLRLLMSYIYIYMEHLFLMFLDHIRRRSTVGMIPLDEWSARRRDLYLTTHDTHNRQISMPPVGFEPTISAGERQRIPPGAWIFVCCECHVLSGRGLCDELITRPEESYRLCCVVVCDLETSRIGAPYMYDISSLRVKYPSCNVLSFLFFTIIVTCNYVLLFAYKICELNCKRHRKIKKLNVTNFVI